MIHYFQHFPPKKISWGVKLNPAEIQQENMEDSVKHKLQNINLKKKKSYQYFFQKSIFELQVRCFV